MRTDVGRIEYPTGLSVSERRFCRRLITAVSESYELVDTIVVSCSGGIDSTVLTHALGQALRIKPNNTNEKVIAATAVYLNHHLRPSETKKESDHVKDICAKWLTFVSQPIDLNVPKGSALQERARNARYEALEKYCDGFARGEKLVKLLTAHNANDNAETMLFNFLKGKQGGIPRIRFVKKNLNICLVRPLLDFTRADIEQYARCFKLTWCEDSSNQTDNYTRNKIRHHLIPWIETNINPGVVKTLTGSK